ncbi:MAG: hypothetical protein VX589_19430, partial [Myxococcota bacterium]|nr:hypothetical protein [Myxococcota bacterium]
GVNSSLYVREGSCQTGDEVLCIREQVVARRKGVLDANANTDYFVFVDSRHFGEPYRLSVTPGACE